MQQPTNIYLYMFTTNILCFHCQNNRNDPEWTSYLYSNKYLQQQSVAHV